MDNVNNELLMVPAPVIPAHAATLNITWDGGQGDLHNGDLLDPVPWDASNADLLAMATEAIANGDIPGVPQGQADLTHFVVDRVPADNAFPYNRLFIRPKTPVG